MVNFAENLVHLPAKKQEEGHSDQKKEQNMNDNRRVSWRER